MSNRNYDIPGLALINHEILVEARRLGHLEEATTNILGKPNYAALKEFNIFNQAQTMSLLYCVLLVPKELWMDSQDAPIYDEIRAYEPERLFTIEKSSKEHRKDPAYWLIRNMRNALAHINYEYETNAELTYMFWNVHKGDKNWEVKISSPNLEIFVNSVGSLLANKALEERKKHKS